MVFQISNYVHWKVVSGGTYGAIVKAWHTETKEYRAIKIIPKGSTRKEYMKDCTLQLITYQTDR